MPTGYKTSKLENGALVVHDVPLMGPQQLTEKHFKNKSIDRAWMKRAIENFAKQCKIGKRPLLLDAHNSKDKAAKVVGRLDNLRIDDVNGEPWLCADVIITDAGQQEKFLAGGLPSKSVEFQPDNYYLRALSLLDGHEGHFDYGIPDFVPEGLYEELVALGADTACTVLCHSMAATAKGSTMDFTLDDIKTAIAGAVAPINERLSKLEGTKQNVRGDIDEELAAVKAQGDADHQVALAKVKREAKIAAYAAQLAAKTRTTEKLAAKALSAFQSDEAMDLYFKTSMKSHEEDVKLGIEREHGDSLDLEQEFKNFKENYPEVKQTFAEYKRLASTLTTEALQARNDRHTYRGVVQVRAEHEAFA